MVEPALHFKELDLGHFVAVLNVELDSLVLFQLKVALKHEQVLVLFVLVEHQNDRVVLLDFKSALVGLSLGNAQVKQTHQHHQVVFKWCGLFKAVLLFNKAKLAMSACVLVQHEVVFV